MGGRAGGGAGFGGGVMSSRDIIAKYPELMTKVKDAATRQELIDGIQEMQKEFGVSPDKIKFYNRKDNTAGYQNDSETGINLKYLGDSKQAKVDYATGYHPAGTEKNPAKATMIHELAHKIEDKSKNWSPKSKFNQELDKAYKGFVSGWRQGKKNNPAAHSLGLYSTTDKHEYFAEALSAYKSGLKNQYTTAAWKIAKKYK